MNHIFISYRRNDAETEAYLLYKDLLSEGYPVFFDHKTLGEGNFRVEIRQQIFDADSVIVFLSGSSFGSKIQNEEDLYRNEIKWALAYNKRIVGIMLENFEGFPDDLPEDIHAIRDLNCLPLNIRYYDAMFAELVSGNFLPPSPSKNVSVPSENAIQATVPRELKQLASLPIEHRMQYTQLLLQIMKTFNDSPVFVRFYRYIDLYDRSSGASEPPKYDGDVPTDLATYLSFFETLYIIIGSGAMGLDVLDFAYRFRFFAGCNVPVMQESELLPLGYQYPNIMALYNLWSDYIVNRYDHSVKCERISDEIPLYDNDLHKQYAAYGFAKKMSVPVKIRFLNRYLEWMNATVCLLSEQNLEECMDLQQLVVDGIESNTEKNIFEPLTVDEMRRSLKEDRCVGIYREGKLIAQMNLLLNPADAENLVFDLSDPSRFSHAAILDYVLVRPDARGFSIQKTLCFIAECIARNYKKAGICAVASPLNTYSIKNFFAQGYRIVDTRSKYRSIRHYMWKQL